jgi:hypothetical protein
MRRGAETLAVAVLFALALAATASAQTKKQTPQEKKRQQLLDELGLRKVDTPPPPPPAPLAPVEATPEEPAAAGPADKGDKKGAAPAAAAGPSFRRAIHPLLGTCQLCHRAGGAGALTRLLLTGDAAADYAAVRPFVNPGNPPASALITKSSGQTHAGGAPWPAGSDTQARVLAWIAKGAKLDGGAAPAPAPTVAAAPVPGHPAPGTKTPPAPAAPVPAPEAAAPPVEAAPPETAVPAPGSPQAAPAPFAAAHGVLMSSCAVCHRPGGPAAATRLLLSGDVAGDEAAARAFIDPATPATSLLLAKARGEMHAGGVVLPSGDPRADVLAAWAASTVAAPAPARGAPTAAAPAPAAVVAPSPPPPPPFMPPHGAGLRLGNFMLNGRFDLNYERRTFSGNPFEDGSTAALRSYHHFLFLSRESASDPFGLSVEMLTLQFWEAHMRLGGGVRPWRLLLSAGKIVVPFGADPLTHQSYGGLAGFDQPILPVIWAQEGAAAHLTLSQGRLLVTDDLFAVRGYALAHADSVLNLQADFSPPEDVRIGFGNRVGVSWFCASAWYSAYGNSLGFGRWLFMQAADLTVSRPRVVPVLGHFSAAAGLLRADVSGGGHGLDYYHFGSYFQLRYHPTDWLYLQYRQGFRSFNNRRGTYVDDTRLGPEDGSTHNFAIVARYHGVTVGLAYFLMFEKADEIPNDFLRASVTYDF